MKGTKSGGSKGKLRNKSGVVAPPTLSEWESALKEVVELASSGEGVTVSELAEQTGCSRGRICKFLRKLICEGKARVTSGGKRSLAIDGQMRKVPSYVLVKNGVQK